MKEPDELAIGRLSARWDGACGAIEAAESFEERCKLELTEALAKYYEIEEDDVVIGEHDCPKSPAGLCIYNTAKGKDPDMECCLICEHGSCRR